MDTPTHGILGGALYAIPVKLTLFAFSMHYPTIIWILFVWGMIEGMWPDLYPWYRWKYFSESRWDDMHRIYHHYAEFTGWKYFPAFRLHVSAIDPSFHTGTVSWWPRMWLTCLAYWSLALVLLYILIFV